LHKCMVRRGGVLEAFLFASLKRCRLGFYWRSGYHFDDDCSLKGAYMLGGLVPASNIARN
jgi:hypothetical protein